MKSEKYESVYILKPDLGEERINQMLEKICELLDENGKTLKIEKIGLRKLAYPIQKHIQGYYLIMDFEIISDNFGKILNQIECKIRTFEEVMKFLIIRKDD